MATFAGVEAVAATLRTEKLKYEVRGFNRGVRWQELVRA
jgi:hypothetical protein